MTENTFIDLDLLDVAKMALKKAGITEGHWEIGVSFHTTPLSAAINNGPTCPTLALQVTGLRLARVGQPTPLSIDASEQVFPEEVAV